MRSLAAFITITYEFKFSVHTEDEKGSIVCGRGNGGIIRSQGEFFPQMSRESNLKIGSLFLQFLADPSKNTGTVMIDALVG